MPSANVNIGSTPGDGTGDTLRAAFNIINTNFANLAAINGNANVVVYATGNANVTATYIPGVTSVAGRTGNVVLTVNDVIGAVSVGNLTAINSSITTLQANAAYQQQWITYLNSNAATQATAINNLTGPVFMANISVGQNVPTSPSTISSFSLVYNNVIKNVSSGYNNTTGIFTAPITGYYQVNAAIGVTPVNWSLVSNYYSNGVLVIYKNNNPIANGPLIDFRGVIINNITVVGVTINSSTSVLVYLVAGETLNCKLAYLTTAPNGFWNTSTNTVQGYFQAVWVRGA